jgi:hypothetical protein
MVAQLTSFQQIYESREQEHYPMAFAQGIIYQHNISPKGYPKTIHLQDF